MTDDRVPLALSKNRLAGQAYPESSSA